MKILSRNQGDKTSNAFTNYSGPYCTVSGSLAFTLHVSRLVGIAPVTFERKNGSLRVRVSAVMCFFSYLLIVVLNAGILAGLVRDFYLDRDHSVRTRSMMAAVAWVMEVVIVMSAVTYAAVSSAGRMRTMIHAMRVLAKVQSKIRQFEPSKILARNRFIIGALFLIFSSSSYIVDFYTFIQGADLEGKDMTVTCLYLCFYVEMLTTFLLEMQFVDVAMNVVSALMTVNNALTDLVGRIRPRENPVETIKTKDHEVFNNVRLVGAFTTAKTNKVMDFVTAKPAKASVDVATVRHLSLSYGAICDVLRQMNDSNGVILILLLLSIFFHLVITPYYLMGYWASKKVRTTSIILQVSNCILHILNMIFVVEPGHRAADEMENIQVLISQLTRRVTSITDPLTLELDLFFKQICLNPISFTPMGFLSLTRPLVATIFSGVTTYLVIILQFQAIDKQNW